MPLSLCRAGVLVAGIVLTGVVGCTESDEGKTGPAGVVPTDAPKSSRGAYEKAPGGMQTNTRPADAKATNANAPAK